MADFEMIGDTPELISSLERSSAEQTKIDLFNLFSKNKENTLEFEILFITLVITAVLSVPSTGTLLDTISKITSFLLIGVTLVKRMGIDNTWKPTEEVFENTFEYIWVLSVFSLFFVVLSLSQVVMSHLIDSPPAILIYLIWSLGLMLLVFSVAVGYEGIFGDMFLWGSVLFYNQYVKFGAFSRMWLVLANLVLNSAPTNFDTQNYAVMKIRHHYQGDKEQRVSPQDAVWMLVILLIPMSFIGLIGGLPYSVITGTGIVISTLTFTIATLSSAGLAGVLSFFYQRYGSSSHDRTPRWSYTIPIILLTLLTHTVGYTDWSLSSINIPPPLF
jgi:hypothetical protein